MWKRLKRLARKTLQRVAVPVMKRVRQWEEEELPQFATMPRNLTIRLPRTITSPERIFFGDDVWLGPGSMLFPVTRAPGGPLWPDSKPRTYQQNFEPRIVIGNRVTATANLTLGAHEAIIIEDDVMFAGNVHLTDGFHGFENVDEPYKYQPISRIAPILIKRGCWIGQNAVILPGVTIGELSIIGANSVVNRDIPARCIAVGAPARVIRKWDEASGKWIVVTS
jgi:acetyltransferase-like isoleucine patch superfamily enzyme